MDQSIPQLSDASTLAAMWAAWEAVKFVGVTDVLKSKLLGKKSALSLTEKRKFDEHISLCEQCAKTHERVACSLDSMRDVLIEIRTMMRDWRR